MNTSMESTDNHEIDLTKCHKNYEQIIDNYIKEKPDQYMNSYDISGYDFKIRNVKESDDVYFESDGKTEFSGRLSRIGINGFEFSLCGDIYRAEANYELTPRFYVSVKNRNSKQICFYFCDEIKVENKIYENIKELCLQIAHIYESSISSI